MPDSPSTNGHPGFNVYDSFTLAGAPGLDGDGQSVKVEQSEAAGPGLIARVRMSRCVSAPTTSSTSAPGSSNRRRQPTPPTMPDLTATRDQTLPLYTNKSKSGSKATSISVICRSQFYATWLDRTRHALDRKQKSRKAHTVYCIPGIVLHGFVVLSQIY